MRLTDGQRDSVGQDEGGGGDGGQGRVERSKGCRGGTPGTETHPAYTTVDTFET